MFKLIKKLFKKGDITVYKYGKAYYFKSFKKATAFMLRG